MMPDTSITKPAAAILPTLRRLFPYVWHYRWRVLIALVLLVASKLATIGVPVLLKQLVDGLNLKIGALVIPALLLIAYGALRLSGSLFQELRQVVFARVLARTSREITLKVFAHLHDLSMRFHLDRRTGEAIGNLLFALNREHRTTLVLVTHDAELAARCARVHELVGGRLL